MDGLVSYLVTVGAELLGDPADGHSPDSGRLEHRDHPTARGMTVVRGVEPGAGFDPGGQRGGVRLTGVAAPGVEARGAPRAAADAGNLVGPLRPPRERL